MSNKISRRAFMKGVGAVAVATAATGILAGCSKDDVDDAVDAVEKKEIRVVFALASGQKIGDYKSMKVPKDATSIDAKKIDPSIVPAGYSVASTGSLKIDNVAGQDTVTVIVTLDPITKEITVKFFDTEKQKYLDKTATMSVAIDATYVESKDVTAPDGYTVVTGTSFINNDEIIVNVTEKPQTVKVIYRRKKLFGGYTTVATKEVTVPKSATTVNKDQIVQEFTEGYIKYKVSDNKPFYTIENGEIKVDVEMTF